MPEHVFSFLDAEIKELPFWKKTGGVNWILGGLIPLFCTSSLLLGAIAAFIGWIDPLK